MICKFCKNIDKLGRFNSYSINYRAKFPNKTIKLPMDILLLINHR